ncbi:MAG: hypothetical protein ETSY1_03585 [Candidatus Entotheonella factor]|uniref:Uncharacterized protein n=1 Tax=Entotheonella factor TaxID=1429438 RepID=W4LWF6_ENTF1|nr:MAG: hypothetical protein ETSY1_03585 [Candidatus Entotheonella factor]
MGTFTFGFDSIGWVVHMLWYWWLGGVGNNGEPACQSMVCQGFLWLVTLVVVVNVSRLLLWFWHGRNR